MAYGNTNIVALHPADWDASAIVAGYWFLNTSAGWQPDSTLVNFLQESSPPVYVGFGSLFMGGGAHKTEMVLVALRLVEQRGILATGWGELTADNAPDTVYVLYAMPHDRLFVMVIMS